MSEEKTLAEVIADTLDETQGPARRKIAQIVRVCGEDFARDIMAQTLEVQAQGGLMLPDESRKRTIGGVFFHLVRNQVSESVRKKLFPSPQQRKKLSKTRRQRQIQNALAAEMTPDEYSQYYKLRTLVIEYQRRIDTMADRYETAGDLEADQQVLVDAQRQVTAIEKQYEHIFQPRAKGGQGRS